MIPLCLFAINVFHQNFPLINYLVQWPRKESHPHILIILITEKYDRMKARSLGETAIEVDFLGRFCLHYCYKQ